MVYFLVLTKKYKWMDVEIWWFCLFKDGRKAAGALLVGVGLPQVIPRFRPVELGGRGCSSNLTLIETKVSIALEQL